MASNRVRSFKLYKAVCLLMTDTSLSPVPPDMARSSVTKFSNALIFKYDNNTKNYN